MSNIDLASDIIPQEESEFSLRLPEKMLPLYEPYRYKAIYGGRATAKSRGFAQVAIAVTSSRSSRFLCVREIQNSTRDSVKRILEDEIRRQDVSDLFNVRHTEITSKVNDSVFVFEGLRTNLDKIRSYEGFNVAWVEEAQSCSQESLDVLEPTIRESGSEVWYCWNPRLATDPVNVKFRGEHGPPPDSFVLRATIEDNPWFPEVLKPHVEFLRKTDPDKCKHVYGGEYLNRSEAEIFGGRWIVDNFTPMGFWGGPYLGLDFGFSTTPTAFVVCWVNDGNLYVEHGTGGLGIEIDQTGPMMSKCFPNAKEYVVRADSARPESISFMRKHGYSKVVAAPKWGGSVKDGISFLRSFKKIIIHPSCDGLIEQATTYKYREDPATGDVLPDIIKGNDDYWDAIRYAIAPLIKSSKIRIHIG